jgi:uncharacterized C2H2 Zn-finger protein
VKNVEVKQRGMGSMFVCARCQTVRQFGFGLPDDVTVEPFLNCSKCGKPTRHQFSRLAPMVGLKLPYGETKWVIESEVLKNA